MVDAILDRKWLAASLFTLLILLIWECMGVLEMLPGYVLPPSGIVTALVSNSIDGGLILASLQSVGLQMSGFLVGASAGVLLGLIVGVSRWAEDFIDPLVSLAYPLPKIALFPVVVIWFGYTDFSRALVIAVSVFFPVFVNAYAGTRGIEGRLIWVARNAEASRVKTFFQVILRAAMPSVSNGIRIGLALSFILTFATESLGASRGGLGALIETGFNDLRYDALWAGIVVFGILGFVADRIWARVSATLLRGQQVEAVGRG